MKIIKSNVFKLLISLFILGFILGIITYFILNTNDFNNYILNYFNIFKNDFSCIKGIIQSLSYNYKYLLLLWISGIILISYLVCPLLLILIGISIGMVFTGAIIVFGIKGFIFCLILLFPCILINIIVYIITSYYSINISNKIIRIIKNNISLNVKEFFKNYFYILIIFLVIELINSLIEIFISSNIIKFVV